MFAGSQRFEIAALLHRSANVHALIYSADIIGLYVKSGGCVNGDA